MRLSRALVTWPNVVAVVPVVPTAWALRAAGLTTFPALTANPTSGRVAYIDLPSFMTEVKLTLDEAAEELKTAYRVDRRTAPVGPYRLRYAVERERTQLDAGSTPASGG